MEYSDIVNLNELDRQLREVVVSDIGKLVKEHKSVEAESAAPEGQVNVLEHRSPESGITYLLGPDGKVALFIPIDKTITDLTKAETVIRLIFDTEDVLRKDEPEE